MAREVPNQCRNSQSYQPPRNQNHGFAAANPRRLAAAMQGRLEAWAVDRWSS